jgi:Flp pilus assembly protein TadG
VTTRRQRLTRLVQRPGESGQSMVEFALVAPIFFLLLFSVIQLGLLMGGQNGLVNAVRETARYAATYRVATQNDAIAACGSGRIQAQFSAALQRAIPGYKATEVAPELTYSWHPDPNGTYFSELKVAATYKFPLYVPLVSAFLDRADGIVDQKLALSAGEEMRVENTPLTSTYPDQPC